MTSVSIEAVSPNHLFSREELDQIDRLKVPKHVAVIMDGNRRWARNNGLPPVMGHWEGAEVLTEIVRAASELGIGTLTVYSFSTENWTRAPEEVEALMRLFEVFLLQKKELMIREGICLETIGALDRFPLSVQDTFLEVKKATAHCRKINLVLALNYGARDEIRRAMVKILELHQMEKLQPAELTEELIAKHLDTSRWGDPQLMIRTSGELRVSNFLLWQISYAEIFVSDKLWPDFSSKDLLKAVETFQKRGRRLGGG